MSWESYCVHRYSCKLILSSGRGLQEAYCKRIFVMSRQQQNCSASYPAYFCIVYYINGTIYKRKYTKRARKCPLARFELKINLAHARAIVTRPSIKGLGTRLPPEGQTGNHGSTEKMCKGTMYPLSSSK